MMHRFSRTELLIGKEGLAKLSRSHVAIFGIGGVGSYAVEALARCGVGTLTLIDHDEVCLTNINRQVQALNSTLGMAKVDAMSERIKLINPEAVVYAVKHFYQPNSAIEPIQSGIDYVIDAVDNVTAKLGIILRCKEIDIPVISSMGTGNKLDPTRFEVSDIAKTSVCPLAKVIRQELRKRSVASGVKVLFSREEPLSPNIYMQPCLADCEESLDAETCSPKRQVPGSISFVPAVAGLIIASTVVKALLKSK